MARDSRYVQARHGIFGTDRRREVLLGVTQDSYVVWVALWWQTGHSHAYHESLSIERRSLSDDVVLDSFHLGEFRASQIEYPEWQREAIPGESFDLGRFILGHDISPVFSYDGDCEVLIRDGALLLERNERTHVLLPAHQVLAALPDLGRNPHVRTCYPVGRHGETSERVWFYSVRYNTASWDDSWTERLLRVPHGVVTEARSRVYQPRGR